DQWMIERGFLDVKTFKDVISSRGAKRLITIEPSQTVAEAVDLMKKYDIEQIPVMNGNGPVGSISEGGLFQKVFDNPDIKHSTIADVLEPTLPLVAFDTPVEKLSSLINRGNGAVLAKDEAGNYHIITKYDVLQALGK
ncbi:MAG: CBS domain-containing protein, partial [Chitinophagaceae bacterium]